MIRALIFHAAVVFAAAVPAIAGDHLIYQNYSELISVERSGRTTIKTVKQVKVADNEGVNQLRHLFTLVYPQSSARRKSFKCERHDAAGKSDSYFSWDLIKLNTSTSGSLTDVVEEIPGLSKVIAADVIECQWVIEFDDLSFASQFDLDDVFPANSRRIEVTSELPSEIRYDLQNGAPAPIVQGNRLVWQLNNVAALPQHYPGQLLVDRTRQIRLARPMMNFYGKSYAVSSWDEIAAWTASISRPHQVADEALKAKVAQLTEGAKTDVIRATRLYDWVRDEHRYVAIELGKNGWEPHNATDVARNKYGDCKDFANLYVTMLRTAGLKAARVYVLTRPDGRISDTFPTPMIFDHAIAAVWLEDHWVFADATHKYLELGLLRSDVEGTRALLLPEEGAAQLITLPVSSADENRMIWNFNAALKDGNAAVRGTVSLFGASAGDFRSGMDSADSTADLYAGMQRWLARSLQGGENYSLSGSYRDVHKPIRIEFSANLSSVQQIDEGHRFVRLLPVTFEEEIASGNPVSDAPIAVGRRYSQLISVEWQLDHPQQVVLPADIILSSPFGALRASFQRTTTGLRVDRELSITRNEISPKEFPDYKAFVLKAQELHNQYFDLGPAQ